MDENNTGFKMQRGALKKNKGNGNADCGPINSSQWTLTCKDVFRFTYSTSVSPLSSHDASPGCHGSLNMSSYLAHHTNVNNIAMETSWLTNGGCRCSVTLCWCFCLCHYLVILLSLVIIYSVYIRIQHIHIHVIIMSWCHETWAAPCRVELVGFPLHFNLTSKWLQQVNKMHT